MKYIVLVVTLIFSISIMAQEEKVKLTRKEKQAILKAERAQSDSIAKAITRHIVVNKQYVLEADRLQSKSGQSVFVMSNINFVAVDSARAVFQLGSAYTMGVNGLGGITIEGKTSSYSMKENKKKGSYYIHMTILAPLGIFDISMLVSAVGNADATVNTMNGGKLYYSGKLVPLKISSVYQGNAL